MEVVQAWFKKTYPDKQFLPPSGEEEEHTAAEDGDGQ